jgi:uncharacterized phage-associated protein
MEHDIVSPKDAADFLLFESRELGEALTNIKLQKLLYYAQAWYLALQDKPLFSEDFEARVNGPVLPSQYQRFKKCEWRPILEKMILPHLPKEISSHLTGIMDVFGIETAIALEVMTRQESPWLEARKGIDADQPSGNVISKESMESFYKSMPQDEKSKEVMKP